MARKVDLTGENITRRRRKDRNYGTKTDLSSTVVERGSTHWAEGSNVHIDGLLGVAGTATVSGVLSVTGTLNASGQINLSGSTAITGPLNVTGTTTIGGNTNITGELNVTGPTTLDGVTEIGGKTTISNDLELIAGGLFKAGVTKIEPNGKATFGSFIIDPSSTRLIQAPGGWLFSSGPDSLGIASSLTSSVNLNSQFAELNYPGSIVRASHQKIDLTALKTWINGQIEVSGTSRFKSGVWMEGLPTTTQPANLHITSQGQIFVSTATP